MRWQDIEMRCKELDEHRRQRLISTVRKRLGTSEVGASEAEISIEIWSSAVLDVELEELWDARELEAICEAAQHPGRDDVHEQREEDQEAEGVLHWPPQPVGSPNR